LDFLYEYYGIVVIRERRVKLRSVGSVASAITDLSSQCRTKVDRCRRGYLYPRATKESCRVSMAGTIVKIARRIGDRPCEAKSSGTGTAVATIAQTATSAPMPGQRAL